MKIALTALLVAGLGVVLAFLAAVASEDGWGGDAGTDAGWSDYRAAKGMRL